MPHSGFPELLKLPDGSVLHIGTDGVWHTGANLHTWTRLDLPGSPYYPRATLLKDGRVLVVGHVGGDDEYGKVDQTIVTQTFRLNVQRDGEKAAAPTRSSSSVAAGRALTLFNDRPQFDVAAEGELDCLAVVDCQLFPVRLGAAHPPPVRQAQAQ